MSGDHGIDGRHQPLRPPEGGRTTNVLVILSYKYLVFGDSCFQQELPKLLFIRKGLVVLNLIIDVLKESRKIRFSKGKRTISTLPAKLPNS